MTQADARIEMMSFDRTERLVSDHARPKTHQHLLDVVTSSSTSIARGAGLSYAAASFGAEARSIDMTHFDRILSFDDTTGAVRVEAGVRIGALTRFLAKKGRILPALPGYPSITVGGCIAFDVHGKSQAHSGNFGDWVEALTLLHRDHGELRCDRQTHADVFALTIGGMGLTGVISTATLKTTALAGSSIEIQPMPARNLEHAAEIMRERSAKADCIYSWNDLNRRGDSFGAGVVYVEKFVSSKDATPTSEPRSAMSINAALPVPLWNRMSTPLILGAYGRLESSKGKRVVPFFDGTFPIYGKEIYYAGFGATGFREAQLIVPYAHWGAFASALRDLLASAGVPVTLGSLKIFSGKQALLRFRGDGICVALDVPESSRARALFERLDQLALQFNATINLSKDSRIDRNICERAFGEYARFRDELARFDPHRRCRSSLRARLGV